MYVNLVSNDCRSRIISHIKRDDSSFDLFQVLHHNLRIPNNHVDNLNSMERLIDHECLKSRTTFNKRMSTTS